MIGTRLLRSVQLYTTNLYGRHVENVVAFDTVSNSEQNLESAFDSIGRQTDKGMMQSIKQLHQDLTDTRISDLYTVENVRIDSPTLDALRILLESRVTAINRCLTYDVVSFQRDLKSWHAYLTTVHAKCIAVLIMN